MGIWGLWGFTKNGERKWTYNQFDSYPESLGIKVFRFCKKTSIEELNKIFNKIILVKYEDKIEQEWQIKYEKYYADVDLYSKENWYSLIRKTQGKPELYNQDLIHMLDGKDYFGTTGIYYAYIIDLDNNKLKVYKDYLEDNGKEMDLICKFNLKDLPDTEEEFLRLIYEELKEMEQYYDNAV